MAKVFGSVFLHSGVSIQSLGVIFPVVSSRSARQPGPGREPATKLF